MAQNKVESVEDEAIADKRSVMTDERREALAKA